MIFPINFALLLPNHLSTIDQGSHLFRNPTMSILNILLRLRDIPRAEIRDAEKKLQTTRLILPEEDYATDQTFFTFFVTAFDRIYTSTLAADEHAFLFTV